MLRFVQIKNIINDHVAELLIDLGFQTTLIREFTIGEITVQHDNQTQKTTLRELKQLIKQTDDNLFATIKTDNTADLFLNYSNHESEKTKPWHYSAKVTNVIDGDTIDANIDLGFGIRINERLRFNDIQTPEIFGKPTESEEYKKGMEAKNFVRQRLEDNNNEFELYSNKIGKWRRWVADIYLTDSSKRLNQELLDKGLADDWETYKKKKQEKPTARTMINLDKSFRSEVEQHAKNKGMTVSELVKKALKQFVSG